MNHRTLPECLALALALLAGDVAAQPIQDYEYRDDAIYQVRAALGITTQVELGPHEEVLDFSTGFSSGWDIVRRGSVFYLRPRNVDVDTNMMVRTSTGSYIFELRVVASDWRALEQAKDAGVHYRVRFAHPRAAGAEAGSGATEAPPPLLDATLQPDRHHHFGYDFAASRRVPAWLVPASVHDDGRFTYLRMPGTEGFPSGSFPAVFGREREHGDDFLVNTTVEDSTIVVHGTYPYLVIRHGGNVVGLRRRGPR